MAKLEDTIRAVNKAGLHWSYDSAYQTAKVWNYGTGVHSFSGRPGTALAGALKACQKLKGHNTINGKAY